MSNAAEIMREREERAARRAQVLDRAEYVLSRLDATTYNAAIAVDPSRPLTGQLAREEHVARALLDVMQELRKATASSEQDAKTPPFKLGHRDSKPTAESPLDRVRSLLRYERQLGHRYIENTLAIEDLRAIALDAARYQVLTLLAEACMITVERYEPDGDDVDPRVSERSMHRVQHDLLSADDVDAFCDARIAERRSQ
jgi:hypothetical protein